VEVLIAAENWGCAPIEVTGQDQSWMIVWFLRWRVWLAQKNKAEESKHKQAMKKSKRRR
jgi:hypothetical protein